ncbi:MAG: cation transporter, partial [Proteobacteria bacterium]|nr:cation transporter [Pseudomonadota bacterium]
MTATSDRGRPHRHGDADNETRLFQAMVLTGVFMVVEVIGGIYSGSLALLADAGHMLIDTAALSLAWLGFRVGRRSPDSRRSYGYHRFQILAAFVNGVTLLFVVGWIVFEAIGRLFEPVEILPRPMLIVAALGLAVNFLVLTLLRAGNGE